MDNLDDKQAQKDAVQRGTHRLIGAVLKEQPCGCTVDGAGNLPSPIRVELCKVHAAGPELLKMLKAIIETQDACAAIEYKGAPAGTDKIRTRAFKAARSAIARIGGSP